MATDKAARDRRADQKFEQAAKAADRHTRPGREQAARLITQGNAIKRGQPVPRHGRDGK